MNSTVVKNYWDPSPFRSKELQSTQEEKVENGIEDEDEDEDDEDDYDDDDDEGSASEKSEESSDDDDIEQLLAPQQQMEEKLWVGYITCLKPKKIWNIPHL